MRRRAVPAASLRLQRLRFGNSRLFSPHKPQPNKKQIIYFIDFAVSEWQNKKFDTTDKDGQKGTKADN
jgi:hypothetical protein